MSANRKRLIEGISAAILLGLVVVAAAILGPSFYREKILNPQLIRALDDAQSEKAYELIRQGADPALSGTRGHTVVFLAAVQGHTQLLQLALSRGLLQKTDRPEWPVIIDAAKLGQPRSVQLLLDAGADPNAHDAFGDTALRWAASNADPFTTAALLARGADPSAPDRDGRTPLDWVLPADAPDTKGPPTRAGSVIQMLRAHGGKRGKELRGSQ